MKRIMLALALAICLCPLAFGEGKTAASDDAWVQVNRACALREAPEDDAEAVAKAPKDAELDYIGKSPDGSQVTVDNIIVQKVEYAWYSGESDRPKVTITGKNSCDYFMGGKHFTGYWVRDNVGVNTVYYDDAGNEVLFNPGTTYIQLLKTEKAVEILG